jgi:hypothetical protein
MKITHNNQPYVLDPARAIELGVLKPEAPKYEIGATFAQGKDRVVIIKDYQTGTYTYIGFDGGLRPWCGAFETIQKAADNLTSYKYIGNVNESFKKLLKDFNG